MVLATLGSGNVAASEWSVQPTLQWYFDHASNRQLSPIGAENDDAAWLTIDAVFKRATETSELDVHPELQIQRFSGDGALNSDNGSLQLAAMNNGEIYSYNAAIGYSDNSTLISELPNTGIIDASTRQRAATGSVNLMDQFSERQRVGLQASYADVVYPGGERVGLVGYRDPGAAVTYTFSLSEPSSLSATAYVNEATAPDVGYESRDVGGRLTWTRVLTMTNSISASAGFSRSTVESEATHGEVWAVRATHNSELAQWAFSVSRDVEPSGRGLLIRRDELDLSVVRSIAARLDATLSVLGAHNSDLVASFTGDDRRYLTGAAGVSWHASAHWVWSFTARESESRIPIVAPYLQRASGWQTALTILWTPHPWSLSR